MTRRGAHLAILTDSFFLVLELQTTAWRALGHWNRNAKNDAQDTLLLTLPLDEGSLTPKKCRRLVNVSNVVGFTMSLTRLVACVEEAVDGKRAVHTLCPYKRSLTGRWSMWFRLNPVENEGNGIDCCSWRTADFESRHHERGSPSFSQCVQNNDDATGSRTSSSAL